MIFRGGGSLSTTHNVFFQGDDKGFSSRMIDEKVKVPARVFVCA